MTLATITLTLLIWFPHLFKLHSFFNLDFGAGFNTIYRNFDGLEYVVIAKSFYYHELIAKIPQPLPLSYFASHFPGYALLILPFAQVLGFLKSMLFVSVLFTIFSAITFYCLVKNFNLTSHPLWLSLVFLIIPARWLVVHSVGSSEPIFIFFILLSLYFFLKFEMINRPILIYLSAIFGALAQITRPPGILLFISLTLYTFWKLITYYHDKLLNRFTKFLFSYFPLLLIPLTLLGIFYYFSISMNDFWAYFHSGDNIHLTFPPFQVFDKHQFWVGDIWLEDIVYTYLLGYLATFLLFKQKLYPLAFFMLTYMVASSLVAHRDISRYILPVAPFALIAFEKVLVSKQFKIVLAILALGIYLYTQNFIIENVAPISNLEIYN